MPPLERFDRPCYHARPRRTELGKVIYGFHRGNRMAGYAITPSFVEFTEFLKTDSRSSVQRAYIREFIHQADPLDWRRIGQNSGVTQYEIARAMIDSKVNRAMPASWSFPRLPGEPCPDLIRMLEGDFVQRSPVYYRSGELVSDDDLARHEI